MKKRSQRAFPAIDDDFCGYIKSGWESGMFDEFSDNHFLIRAIENRISDIEWSTQLLSNNLNSIYTPINEHKKIDFSFFSSTFVTNLSMRLNQMSIMFGQDKINVFVKKQLSAGGKNYNQDQFFQALSEIEILCFLGSRCKWDAAIYEPPIGINGSNPEARFEVVSDKNENFAINIEVKTPKFPLYSNSRKRLLIPTVLLNKRGREQIEQLCNKNNIECMLPRVTKLVDFINSAAKKFKKPQINEFNLLYINWSYSDFPSNSFLEAWSLLTNELNGVLTHKEIGTKLDFKEAISCDAYEKISAVIVYTSSLDQLMFSDFSYVWQTTPQVGQRFRMLVLNPDIDKEMLFSLTGMNPHNPSKDKFRLMFERNWTNKTSVKRQAEDAFLYTEVLRIIEQEYLSD